MDALAERAVRQLIHHKRVITTAESCTGGMLAAALTSVPGSSAIFQRGFITYSNQAKIEDLGVDPQIIDQHGAVSAECAHAMALGALTRTKADMAIAITGIAGPDGGTPDKPVGTVWMALVTRAGGEQRVEFINPPYDLTRGAIRSGAVITALEWICACD